MKYYQLKCKYMTGANGKHLISGRTYRDIDFANLAAHIAAGDVIEVNADGSELPTTTEKPAKKEK